MMDRLNPRARSDRFGSRLERRHSVTAATVIPWISIVMASVLPVFIIATALPIVPPLGFVLFLSWRMVRPGLLPVWAGFPLGAVDDLFNGQPFGFAIMAWSLAMLAIDAIEAWFPWRSFVLDWITAAVIIVLYVLSGVVLSGAVLSGPLFAAALPQMVFAVLIVPVAARLVAGLDRLRLRRWRAAS